MWYFIWLVGMGAILAGCICGMIWLERKGAFALEERAGLPPGAAE
ncbi:MAG: hypothetical protein H6R01_1722 [Burkholderiaceae bacterium]|nr:hypothetical protein [Burkholderiaceae bacterium]